VSTLFKSNVKQIVSRLASSSTLALCFLFNIEALANESSKKELVLSSAQSRAKSVECISIADNLVDLPDKASSKNQIEKFSRSLISASGGTEITKRHRTADIWKLAADKNAKAIFKLGLIDSFMPIYLFTDKKKSVCQSRGCQAQLVYSPAGYVDYGVTNSAYEAFDEKISISKSSVVALGYGQDREFSPTLADSTTDVLAIGLYFLSETDRFAVIIGKDETMEIVGKLATSECPSKNAGTQAICLAFDKLHQELLTSKQGPDSDKTISENKTGLPVYYIGNLNYWKPSVARKELCKH